MNNEKINILNLTQEELTELLVSLGLKKFYGKEVFETTEFLEKFLRNLLLGEKNILKNRDLHI